MHIYELDGVQYPSVTTIIKLISINDDLMKWANYMGFKRKNIKEIQDESAEFGTIVHSNLRAIIDPNAPPADIFKDPRKEYEFSIIKRRFIEYFSSIEYKTIDTEMTLISPKFGYAGTLDWLARISDGKKDRLLLLDFKTSKSIKTTMYLQLGGYYNLLKEININVDGAGIIIVNERECTMHPISKEKLEEFSETFISLVSFYKMWEKFSDFKPEYDIIRILKKQNDNT